MRSGSRGGRRVLDAFFHGRAINEELEAGDDHVIAGLEAAANDIIIDDDVAYLNHLLARDRSSVVVFGDEDKKLAIDSRHGEDRNQQPLRCAPSEASADEFVGAEFAAEIGDERLSEDGLSS